MFVSGFNRNFRQKWALAAELLSKKFWGLQDLLLCLGRKNIQRLRDLKKRMPKSAPNWHSSFKIAIWKIYIQYLSLYMSCIGYIAILEAWREQTPKRVRPWVATPGHHWECHNISCEADHMHHIPGVAVSLSPKIGNLQKMWTYGRQKQSIIMLWKLPEIGASLARTNPNWVPVRYVFGFGETPPWHVLTDFFPPRRRCEEDLWTYGHGSASLLWICQKIENTYIKPIWVCQCFAISALQPFYSRESCYFWS